MAVNWGKVKIVRRFITGPVLYFSLLSAGLWYDKKNREIYLQGLIKEVEEVKEDIAKKRAVLAEEVEARRQQQARHS